MRKIPKSYFFAGLCFALYSCASSIPHSDAIHQAWAEKKWKHIDLGEGRALYATNCSGCHSLHSPSEYTQIEWLKFFNEMASKAHMASQDSVSVLAYLISYGKDNNLDRK
jgi:hypothetical protein